MTQTTRCLWIPVAIALGLALAFCGDDDHQADAGSDGGPACGNGELDPGEECDDGNDDNTDGCCNTCLLCPGVCDEEPRAQCEPNDSVCCPTPEDLPTECAPHRDYPDYALCLMACESTTDCYWSNQCDRDYPGHCYPAYCGPAVDGTGVNRPCAVNGQTGWCYPQSTAESLWGLCVEPGTLPQRAACEAGYYLDEIPRLVPTCQGGVCSAWAPGRAPTCQRFCDPVAAWDATVLGGDGCLMGTNCLNYSYLYAGSNRRSADRGLCVPTPATDPEGILSCDLLSQELIGNRSWHCADLLPGSRCGFFRTGSLYGTCQPADATPIGLGDACTTDATSLACPAGAVCWPADPFNTEDATPLVCLQVCDASDLSPSCDATGMACTSLSFSTEDASPTRFGLCAPPPLAP